MKISNVILFIIIKIVNKYSALGNWFNKLGLFNMKDLLGPLNNTNHGYMYKHKRYLKFKLKWKKKIIAIIYGVFPSGTVPIFSLFILTAAVCKRYFTL